MPGLVRNACGGFGIVGDEAVFCGDFLDGFWTDEDGRGAKSRV